MTENILHNNSMDKISGCGYKFAALWAAGLILFYVISGYFAVLLLGYVILNLLLPIAAK
jgi:hypothetical protein